MTDLLHNYSQNITICSWNTLKLFFILNEMTGLFLPEKKKLLQDSVYSRLEQ